MKQILVLYNFIFFTNIFDVLLVGNEIVTILRNLYSRVGRGRERAVNIIISLLTSNNAAVRIIKIQYMDN